MLNIVFRRLRQITFNYFIKNTSVDDLFSTQTGWLFYSQNIDYPVLRIFYKRALLDYCLNFIDALDETTTSFLSPKIKYFYNVLFVKPNNYTKSFNILVNRLSILAYVVNYSTDPKLYTKKKIEKPIIIAQKFYSLFKEVIN